MPIIGGSGAHHQDARDQLVESRWVECSFSVPPLPGLSDVAHQSALQVGHHQKPVRHVVGPAERAG